MDFSKISLRLIISILLIGVLIVGLLNWKYSTKTRISEEENITAIPDPQNEMIKENNDSIPKISNQEDSKIQEQLEHDRQQQKQTKDLKIKLEQTNLELEREKAIAEINKLKNEDTGGFKETAISGQKDLPEIKVEYIGGGSVKKEAILSIAGVNYQIKDKSSLLDNIQVISISDSSVTLHFNAPQELIKIIDFKPE
jgi:hypothetical protein